MSIQIIREVKNRETGKVMVREDITSGCKLLPFYDPIHRQQGKMRVVFNPGNRGDAGNPVIPGHPVVGGQNGEENVGVKYPDGSYEPQPGFAFLNCPLHDPDPIVTYSHIVDDAGNAIPLEGATDEMKTGVVVDGETGAETNMDDAIAAAAALAANKEIEE